MTLLTYQYRDYPNSKCSVCRCQLPTNANGYCQRCNTGWLGFIDLESASDDTLRRELRLAEHALVSEEVRGGYSRDLYTLIESIKEELESRN